MKLRKRKLSIAGNVANSKKLNVITHRFGVRNYWNQTMKPRQNWRDKNLGVRHETPHPWCSVWLLNERSECPRPRAMAISKSRGTRMVSSPDAARQSCYFMLWRSRRLLVGFI